MSGFLVFLASTASAVAALAAYYNFFVSKKPKLYTGNGKLSKFLESHVPMLKANYNPSPLFWEGRLQTILGLTHRVTTPSKFPYKRKLFSLKDGGEIALDFAEVETPADGKPMVVLVFPGLTSSSQTCYVRTLVRTMNASGASVVVFNNRGIGGVPFKTARTYSASNTEDAVEVIAYLKQKYPGQRMMAVGTSLGAMVLSKYLITYRKEAAETFESAVLISIPWDANGGTANLETNFINRYVINKELTKSLVKLATKFMKSVKELPPTFNFQAVLNAKTVREFDTVVTAPQFGFASVKDYYTSATIKGHCNEFPIPVFGLNALDDPISPGRDLPIDEAESSVSKLALVVTSHGGHLGFLEGTRKREKHFLERFMGELIQGIRLHGETELKF